MTTPSFSHLDVGTDPDAWQCARALPSLSLEDIVAPSGTLVVVAAHPDDETLGVGGLIAIAAAQGHNVDVILCSDGEASHPGSPTHSPEQLSRIRRQEFAAALAALEGMEGPEHQSPGSVRTVVLGLPDGELAQHSERIASEIRNVATRRSTIAAPLREDGHPDHTAAATAAAQVAADIGAALVEYPIWYWHWASPASDTRWRTMRPLRLDEAAAQAKRRALEAYPSQTKPLSQATEDAAVLTSAFLGHFSHDTEVLRLSTPGRGSAGDSRATFNTLFESDPDPWHFDNEYETRKREILLASLPRRRYRTALELGSATGALTARLAQRCDHVIAVDASDAAIEQSRPQLANYKNICFYRCEIPHNWPDIDAVDLVIVSEIGYFLTRDELVSTYEHVERAVAADAHILLCHWLHPIDGWSLTGTDVHQAAHDRGWRTILTHRESDFLLEVFTLSTQSARGST